MSSGSVSTSSLSSLQTLLDRGSALTPAEAVSILRQLLSQVRSLHASGRIHRAIDAKSVRLDAAGIFTISAPEPLISLAGDADYDACPPELRRAPRLHLPVDVVAARQVLAAAGVELDPCRIDLYQLGALLCRLLTRQPVVAYFRSPQVKSQVPAHMQTVLERALGYRTADRFVDAAAFAAALEPLAASETPLPASAAVLSPTPPVGAPPLAEPAADLPVTRLGQYQVLRRIGHGGMGDVFLGYEEALQRHVALKVLPAELARNDDFVRRFRAEAAAIARLSHPHVVPLYFFGKDGPHYFFVMQYVEGESLDRLLARRGRLDVTEVLTLLEQCLAGLSAAHRAGLVHRDVKPGNILLEGKTGRALVADFGLVKSSGSGMTATGTILGTVDYMAPEQARGKKADARSDLYSLGVLTYQMLSGRLPFEAETPSALLFLHAYEAPPPLFEVAPDVPPALVEVVAKLMAKEPAARYQRCADVLADLQRCRVGKPLATDEIKSLFAPAEPSPRGAQVWERDELEDVAAPHPVGWWQRLLGRVQPHAPELVRKLQSTTQQVDGALAEYQGRRDRLASLVQEAKAAGAELAEQARLCREAAAASPTAREREECAHSANELEAQAAEQRDQTAALELQLVKIESTLAKLQSQRDLLNARLRMAEARLRLETKPPRRRVPVTAAVVLLGACVLGGILLVGALMFFKSAKEMPSPLIPVAENPPDTAITPPVAKKDDLSTPASAPGSRIDELDRPKTKIKNPVTAQPPPSVAVAPQPTPSKLFHGQETLVRTFKGHQGSVIHSVAFSPDSKMLASESNLGVLCLWDAATGKELKTFTQQKSSILQVVFAPDGKTLATGGLSGMIHLWEVATGKELPPLHHGDWHIHALAFAQDSNTLASGSSDVRMWDLKTREFRLFPSKGRQSFVDCLAFSPDGKLLAAGGNSLRYWDVLTAQELPPLESKQGYITAVAFASDNKTLASGSSDCTVQLWDVATRQPLRQLKGHLDPISSLAFSLDGKRLFSGAGGLRFNPGQRGEVKMWDVDSGMEQAVFEGHKCGVWCVRVAPDGSLLASSDARQTVRLWTMPDKNLSSAKPTLPPVKRESSIVQELRRFEGTSGRIFTLKVSSSGRRALAGGENGALCLWDVDKGLEPQRLKGHTGWVQCVAMSSDGSRAVSSSTDSTVRVWNVDSAQELHRLNGHKQGAIRAAFSADGKHVVTGEYDGTVHLWDVDSGKEISRFQGHLGMIYSVAISPDGKRILSGSQDRTARLWDVQNAKELRRLDFTLMIFCGAFSPNGRRALIGDEKGVIHVLDGETGAELRQFEAHLGGVSRVVFSSDGMLALTGGGDKTMRLWNVETGKELRRFEGSEQRISDLALLLNGQAFSCSPDGTIRAWELPR